MVECGGLENRWGSHLRGFESLFLRQKSSSRNCEMSFFFLYKRQTCLSAKDKKKKVKTYEVWISFFETSPSGISVANPKSITTISWSWNEKDKDALASGFFEATSLWDHFEKVIPFNSPCKFLYTSMRRFHISGTNKYDREKQFKAYNVTRWSNH